MYSITRKSGSSWTSMVATTFGCRTRAASRASSRNIATKSGSVAMWGCMLLMATSRSNPPAPSARPRYTVAIPPDAMARIVS